VKAVRFPYELKRGSTAVRIYRLKRPATALQTAREVYTLAWYAGDLRQTKQFSDLDAAVEEANLKLDQLSAGKINAAAEIDIEDAAILDQARKIAGDIPILAALQEWQTARSFAGGELVPAAEAWAMRHANLLKQATVTEAVSRFLAAKEKDGYATKDTQGSIFESLSRSVLGAQLIGSVSSTAIQAYLDAIPNRTSRNTHRKRVVTLWRWARSVDLLPRDMQTEAERTARAKEDAPEIGIIDAAVLESWLGFVRRDAPADLPALVLSAFCGMRRAEVHGQTWEAINLAEGHLHVNAAKEGTPANRLVPLCPAAIQWLMLCPHRNGPVCEGVAVDRTRKLGREYKLTLPENCTRHSWISYRLAESKDLAATALEAGNSPQIIRKHYLKLRSATQAAQWFGILPSMAKRTGTIIRIRSASRKSVRS
jgi:integrase